MNFQDLIDGMSARMQKERASTQMTLGDLIESLEKMPTDAQVANIGGAHSYRGYYSDLAFKHREGTRPAFDLLAECRFAMGRVFDGYKGGEFVMGERTPVWVADYGCCGLKLMSLNEDGGITTQPDD